MADNVKMFDEMVLDLRTFEGSAATARARAEAALAHEMEGNTRIRAWLVAANAGALLICFNTMLGGQICDWIAFRPLVFVFVLGLALAFFSVMAERRAHGVYRGLMAETASIATKIVAQVQAFEVVRPKVVSGDENAVIVELKPAAALFEELKAKTKRLNEVDTGFWHTASGWLEMGSVAALACGLVWAVSDASFIQALCASPVQLENTR